MARTYGAAAMKTPIRHLLGVTACAAALTAPAAAHAETTIDTISGWDGAGEVPFFSPVAMTQIGQPIVVPAGETTLSSFTFMLSSVDDPATVVFRPAVYVWNGAAPDPGPLWEGPPTTLAQGGGVPGVMCSTPGTCTYQPVTFDTGDIPVTPGQRLVLMLTTLEDSSSGFMSWGTTPDASYPPDTSAGSIAPSLALMFNLASWGPLPEDLAFRAVFGADRNRVTRPPFVDALSSSGGSSAGGERVVIRGENFTADSTVRFGDVPAASVTVDRFDQITAVTPPHEPGGFDVRVETQRGISPIVDADAYTFVAPPAEAPTAAPPAPAASEPPAKATHKSKKRKRSKRPRTGRP
jgi:hypothetical protein